MQINPKLQTLLLETSTNQLNQTVSHNLTQQTRIWTWTWTLHLHWHVDNGANLRKCHT